MWRRLFPAVALSALGLFLSQEAEAQQLTRITTGPLATDVNDCRVGVWADYDGDGDLDLFVPTVGPNLGNPFGHNSLYMNTCNGNFVRVAAMPGGMLTHSSHGSMWGDFDNDGWPDLFVGGVSGSNDVVYKNLRNGSFAPLATNAYASILVSLADVDNDGFLDIYGSNNSSNNGLFLNLGGTGFAQDTASPIANNASTSIGLSFADYDSNGSMDLYVSNTWINSTNQLYSNAAGAFSPVTGTAATAFTTVTYGSAWADYDNDGDLDLFVPELPPRHNHLLKNDGLGGFSEVLTGDVVTDAPYITQGSAWGDYDSDGDLDLFVASYHQNALYRNDGDDAFTKITNEEPVNEPLVGESTDASWADFDNDGDLDLFVGNTDWGPYFGNQFYINSGNPNHWLKLRPRGTVTNGSAVGARVYLTATIFGQAATQMREINANGLLSGNAGGVSGAEVHFGLGDATVIDQLTVVWPTSGYQQTWTAVPVDAIYDLVEGPSPSGALTLSAPCVPDLPGTEASDITGTTFLRSDNACVLDPTGSPGVGNRLVQLADQSGGLRFALSDPSGGFHFNVPPGTYEVSVVPTPLTQDACSPAPAAAANAQSLVSPTTSYQVTVAAGQQSGGNHFPLSPGCGGQATVVPIYDPPAPPPPVGNALSPWPDCGCRSAGCASPPTPRTTACAGTSCFSSCVTEYCSTYVNSGTSPINTGGTLNLRMPTGALTYLGFDPVLSTCDDASPTPLVGSTTPTILGAGTATTTYQWSATRPMGGGESCQICIYANATSCPGGSLNVKPVLQGDCGSGWMNWPGPDIVEPCACACDPNDKSVSPNGCGGDSAIVPDQPLTFKVRFQNIGGTNAHDVIVRDQLDPNLDLSTFQVGSTSHPLTGVQIRPDRSMIWTFAGIELPPEIADAAGSNGFFSYQIEPLPGLPEGTPIQNTAHIYFDQNEAVITNTTLSTIHDDAPIATDYVATRLCGTNAYDFTYTGGAADVGFSWDFGPDATPAESTDPNPSGIVFASSGPKSVTLTIWDAGCQTSSRTTLDVPDPNGQVEAYALLGLSSVTIKPNASVLGGAVGVVDPAGTLAIENNATLADFVAAATLALDPNASVGVAYASSVNRPDNVGALFPFVPFGTLPSVPALTPGAAAVTVAAKKMATLAPGSYGAVSLGKSAGLSLSGGTYSIASITMDSGGWVRAESPVTLLVAGSVNLGAAAALEPAPPATAQSLLVYAGGSVSLGTHATLVANVYAPGSAISVSPHAEVEGSLLGDTILLSPNASVDLQGGCFP